MEAVLMKNLGSGDYYNSLSSSSYKNRAGDPVYPGPVNRRPLISHYSGNFYPVNNFHGGLLSTPPPPAANYFLSHSFPPNSISGLRQSPPPQNNRNQPPLLPLPVPVPQNHRRSHNGVVISANNVNTSNISSKGTALKTASSSAPVNRRLKSSRSREQSLTPKKSKNQKKVAPVETPPPEKSGMVGSGDRMGPDPKELPKALDVSGNSVLFTPSPPPPSSLPLPTFSLRPKFSCNIQAAAGVDAGATDGLRRLLRLP